MTRETDIAGSPSSIAAIGTWLEGTFANGASELADDVYRAHSQAGSAWESDAATAFRHELRRLGDSSDSIAAVATALAREVTDLVGVLRAAQGEMAHARSIASAGGLTVTGTLVHPPGPAPAAVPGLAVDATPAEHASHQEALRVIDTYEQQVDAWNRAVTIADKADADWQQAVADLSPTWQAHGYNISNLLQALFTGTAEASIQVRISKWYADSARTFRQRSGVWHQIAESYVRDGHFAGSRDSFYEALGKAKDLDDAARLATMNAEYGASRVATNVGRGFVALGVVATGYGIYADLRDGESGTQATTSNVGGFLAGVGAGAMTGAAVGTFLGPGPGTAIGAVVGAGIGIVTSGAIDSMFENGVDSLSDVGSAIADGAGELVDTGSAIVDMGAGAADAVGDGISDAWNSVFG